MTKNNLGLLGQNKIQKITYTFGQNESSYIVLETFENVYSIR